MTKDTLETIGKIHDRDEHRDAIHIAVLPVEAGERLKPGEHVDVTRGVATGTTVGNGIGIVDPYLEDHVNSGQRFWLFLYPRTITSLRHVWTHPELPDEPAVALAPIGAKAEAEAWLREHAEACDVSYSRLMDAAETWLEHGDYELTTESGRDAGYTDAEGFWTRYELVTGKSVPKDKRESFFTCSC